MYIHTQTHTNTYTHTRINTHVHAHAHATRTRTRIRTRTHSRLRWRSRTRTLSCTDIDISIYVYVQKARTQNIIIRNIVGFLEQICPNSWWNGWRRHGCPYSWDLEYINAQEESHLNHTRNVRRHYWSDFPAYPLYICGNCELIPLLHITVGVLYQIHGAQRQQKKNIPGSGLRST